jgi:hypothetical protein
MRLKLPRQIKTNHPLGGVINDIIAALYKLQPQDGKNAKVRVGPNGFAYDVTAPGGSSKSAPQKSTAAADTVSRWQ